MKKSILVVCLMVVLTLMTSCSNTPKGFKVSELLKFPEILIGGEVKTEYTKFDVSGNYNTQNGSGFFTIILDSLVEKKDEEVKLYIENDIVYIPKKDVFLLLNFFNKYNVPPELKGEVYNNYKEDILDVEYIKIVDFETLFKYLNDNVEYKNSEKILNTYILRCEIYNNFLSVNYDINLEFKENKEKSNQALPDLQNYISLDTFKSEHNELRDNLNPVEILEVNWVTNAKIAYLDESRREGTNLDTTKCIIINEELYLPIELLFQKFNENLEKYENKNEYYTIKKGNNIHLNTENFEGVSYFKLKDLNKIGYKVYADLAPYNIIVIVK